MAELDGTWNVRRTGGLLPPLVGVRKHIDGSSGETRVGPLPSAPFDVVGLEFVGDGVVVDKNKIKRS